jgi:hypothetical protein
MRDIPERVKIDCLGIDCAYASLIGIAIVKQNAGVVWLSNEETSGGERTVSGLR